MLYKNNFDFPIYSKKFIKHLERLNYSTETTIGYSKDLKKFQQFLFTEYSGNILTEHIQKEDILDYLNSLKESGLKLNSIARNLSSLKSLFKFLVNEMNFPIDIAARIKHPKVYTPLPDILDVFEIQELLETAKANSTFYYVLFSLLYYTGSRLTPVRTLKKDHVDLRNRKIYFEKIKNGKDLYLPLNETLFEILNEYLIQSNNQHSKFVFNSPKLPNKPISPSDIRLNLKKLCKTAGISKRVTPHTLRHCTATHLTLKGVEQKFIASILGHNDLRSTARYQQLNVDNLRPSINKLGIEHEKSHNQIFDTK